jgi:hypothetical protein
VVLAATLYRQGQAVSSNFRKEAIGKVRAFEV